MRSFLAVLRGLLLAAGPLFTLASCLGLLLLGAHAAGHPVATLARAILDGLDGAVDALGTWAIRAWAGTMGWRDATADAWVERWVGLVDVQEKLALVHLLGLVVEGTLALALLPVAWHARPVEWPGWQAPHRAVAAWWKGLRPWVRAERVLLLPGIIIGVVRVAQAVRVQAVAGLASTRADVVLGQLSAVGWTATVVAAVLVTWHAALPLVLSSPEASLRAGRTRRITTLLLAPLWILALLEAAW